ncbi:5'-nucleotidase C-terminal domain-containing protein, partial [Nitrosomonas sp. Nm33]|uniref:5'-nucleotidase C-terminal domain-containing protein n=1 Tax=Nitrosomonas sp. Nm33 TaxID=133724 RepID=UPI0008997C61
QNLRCQTRKSSSSRFTIPSLGSWLELKEEFRFNRILQVSHGYTYEWKEKGTPCDNVNPTSIKVNGIMVDPEKSYRVTVNSFLAEGGDQFYVLKEGIDRMGGALDLDALEAYFVTNSPVAPGPQNRITLLP